MVEVTKPYVWMGHESMKTADQPYDMPGRTCFLQVDGTLPDRTHRAATSSIRANAPGADQSVSSPASSSISSPSCQDPSADRSYWRITPTGRKPTFA